MGRSSRIGACLLLVVAVFVAGCGDAANDQKQVEKNPINQNSRKNDESQK